MGDTNGNRRKQPLPDLQEGDELTEEDLTMDDRLDDRISEEDELDRQRRENVRRLSE